MTAFANKADMQAAAITELGTPYPVLRHGKVALFSSDPLDEPRAGKSSAVIVIHGALRNAGHYYQVVQDAAGDRARSCIIVAPQFLTNVDVQDLPGGTRFLHWATEGWKGGLEARKGRLRRVSSFQVMDQLLKALDSFPGLHRITIVGNSAGGQFVNRYAAVGRGPEMINIPVRFVVANPSTYLYFDRQRPTRGGFAVSDDPQVNQWRYGFGGKLPKYVDGSAAEYFKKYIARDVVYLLGEEDSNPDAALLEVHPAALAQGRVRRERGELYCDYLAHKAGHDVHQLVPVKGVGHDASELFTSPEGRKQLFGDLPSPY